MTKPVYLLVSFLLLTAPMVSAVAFDRASVTTSVADEEYDRYKKRGDDFFKEGKYQEARRQYQNCLEVPGFENDAYATKQIDECSKALSLRQQATEALKQNKNQEAIQILNQLLTRNPGDNISREQLADYYEAQGNQLSNQKNYTAAREIYTQALKYATTTTRQESLRLQIANTSNVQRPAKNIGIKVFTGLVAVGAGAFAVLLRNDYQNKLNTLNQISQTADPTGTGIISDDGLYQQYNAAYGAVESAQKRNSLYKASLGVAAVATIAELYLLLHKPKKAPRTTGFHWQPSSQSLGVAVHYTF